LEVNQLGVRGRVNPLRVFVLYRRSLAYQWGCYPLRVNQLWG